MFAEHANNTTIHMKPSCKKLNIRTPLLGGPNALVPSFKGSAININNAKLNEWFDKNINLLSTVRHQLLTWHSVTSVNVCAINLESCFTYVILYFSYCLYRVRNVSVHSESAIQGQLKQTVAILPKLRGYECALVFILRGCATGSSVQYERINQRDALPPRSFPLGFVCSDNQCATTAPIAVFWDPARCKYRVIGDCFSSLCTTGLSFCSSASLCLRSVWFTLRLQKEGCTGHPLMIPRGMWI